MNKIKELILADTGLFVSRISSLGLIVIEPGLGPGDRRFLGKIVTELGLESSLNPRTHAISPTALESQGQYRMFHVSWFAVLSRINW